MSLGLFETIIELTTPWNCSGSPAASKWPVDNFAVLGHCALQCPGLLQAKQETGLACATLVWTMGIRLPLHWLGGAAATGVNAEGSLLLFVGLYFNRSLCLTWVSALASALINLCLVIGVIRKVFSLVFSNQWPPKVGLFGQKNVFLPLQQ